MVAPSPDGGELTPLLFVALAVAGGLGAALRLLVDGLVQERTSIAYPLGTMIINVSGSFLLGLLTGLAVASVLPAEWRLILGTGFLGGYTTFSTASFETVRLAQQHRVLAAVVNGIGMLLLGVAAAALGFLVGLAVAGGP